MKKSASLSPLFWLLSSSMFMIILFLLLSLVVNNKTVTATDSAATTDVCDESTHRCLHGGECKRSILVFSGESVQACDCTNAVEDDGTKYVGLHCETDVPNTNDDARVCKKSGLFCLNNGVCPDDPNDPKGCSCTDEYTGVNCELEKSSNIIQNLSKNSSECTMVCQNDGNCQFGMLPEYLEGEITNDKYAADQQTNDEDDEDDEFFYQHCRCQEGYYGMNCEKKHKTCGGPKFSNNDSNYCHHGSTCIDVSELRNFDQGQVACDCSAGNALFENVAFAGKYCNIQSTSICSSNFDSLNGHQFCANYGTCNQEGQGIYSCSCADGYRGDHCEYAPGQPMPAPEDEICTQTVCQNGGKCRFGKKSHGPAMTQLLSKQKARKALGHMLELTNGNENFEHCVCPPGFAGTSCEYEAEVCPDGKQVCFNGSECIKKTKKNDDDDEDKYGCSCNDEDTLNRDDDDSLRRKMDETLSFGGKYCQSEADSICKTGRTCMNGGDCDGEFDTCRCIDGFRGPYCKDSKDTLLQDIYNQNPNNKDDDDKKEVDILLEDHRNNVNSAASSSSEVDNNNKSHPPRRHRRQNSSKVILFSFAVVFLVISLVVLNMTLNDKDGIDEQPADDYLMKGRSRRLSFLKEQQELHSARLQTNHYPTIPRTIFETVDINGGGITSGGVRDPSIADLM